MQEGKSGVLAIRPMPSIAPNVFELKTADERKWYRMIYLARIKDTAKTERRDLDLAEQRWKLVQQRLREELRARKKEQ